MTGIRRTSLNASKLSWTIPKSLSGYQLSSKNHTLISLGNFDQSQKQSTAIVFLFWICYNSKLYFAFSLDHHNNIIFSALLCGGPSNKYFDTQSLNYDYAFIQKFKMIDLNGEWHRTNQIYHFRPTKEFFGRENISYSSRLTHFYTGLVFIILATHCKAFEQRNIFMIEKQCL